MRIASAWLVLLMILVLAAGCKRGNRDIPAGNPDGDKKDALAKAPPNPNQDGGAKPVKKGPQSLLGNIRARGQKVEQDNEMVQLTTFFNTYCVDFPNANGRNLDGFLDSIKRQAGAIHNKIKVEKFYTVNVKAKMASDDILAFETELYSEGYRCVRANNALEYVPEKQLKATLGIP
ncbi:MAG: hypothetical protein EXR98_22500 [Gemmataceae bacterium]|nr:hypothetical protein [Gemmataceae bacterium]